MTGDLGLFPELEPVEPPAPAPKLSADQRRTRRQHDRAAAGIHPLVDFGARYNTDATAAGNTCGDCSHRGRGGYPKCMLRRVVGDRVHHPRATHSAATDCRAWWPACTDWTPPEASQ